MRSLLMFTGILLCLPSVLWGQQGITDTTVLLNGVEVTETRLQIFSSGHIYERIDSAAMVCSGAQSLSDLINRNQLMVIRSNGPGGVSSISLRGTTANHTAVNWNGFNLQSPMNGGVDLSLIPVGMSDRISIEYGGAGALQGSGVMGGSINLNRDMGFNSGLSVLAGSSAASYDNYFGRLVAEYGNKKSFTTLRAYARSALNDFPFVNTTLAGSPEVVQQNAQLRNWGVMLGQDIRIKTHGWISADVLSARSYREIPPLMTQSGHTAFLDDQNLLARIVGSVYVRDATIIVRSALIRSDQHYVDSITGVDANNDFLNSITEIETFLPIGQCHLMNVGAVNYFEQITTNNYADGRASRDRMALFASYKYIGPKENLHLSASLRGEYTGTRFLPPIPSAGLIWRIWKVCYLRASATRIYRLPTFNDLYWNPGGNPDLEPEQGWSEEIGIGFWKEFDRSNLKLSSTFYNANINNWILWLPSGGLWSPRNVMKVWTRGVETLVTASFNWSAWSLEISGRYFYTRASNQKALSPSDASVGKQLIYVPKHFSSAQIQIGFKGFLLNYIHSFTSERYLSSDNLSDLASYDLGAISLSKDIKIKTTHILLGFRVENLWDEDWQSVAWMPMPGRYYDLSLTYQFNKPKK